MKETVNKTKSNISPAVTSDLSHWRGVWVWVEEEDNEICRVSFELLGKAKELAKELNTFVCAVYLGYKVKEKVNRLFYKGAERVIVVDREELRNFISENYANVIVYLVKKYKPEIFLAGATIRGRSLFSQVAVRLNTGLTADCVGLEVDRSNRLLIQTKPALGDNVMAQIITPKHRPQMATVRYKVMKELKEDSSYKGEAIEENLDKGLEFVDERIKFIEFIKEDISEVNLTEAEIIVGVGRGVKEAKNIRLIEELAKTLGAGIGASRAAVDSGWLPYSHQIGQTGITVAPKVYIACGISGQIQHLVGIQSSKVIVAINKDPCAPIFNIADFGIVGDLFEIVPLLIEKFKKVKSI